MGTASFLELSFELEGLDPDAVEAVCLTCGATAVTFVDARDDAILEPLPGEFRLWPRTRVRALFPGEGDRQAITRSVAAGLGIEPFRIQATAVADRVWEREWLKDFHPLRFGQRLWVCPRHASVDETGAVVVWLDPGLAFGTGTHPTTALCLEWLDAHLAPAASVIDYGCGSGILALAALKLGAARAQCFDIDLQALVASRDNAAANNVLDRLDIRELPDEIEPGADLLLANILSGPLISLAPRFAALLRPGGTVVLAGLMEHEVPEVTRAYEACFDIAAFGKRDDWVGLSGRRRIA